ncbi:PREDICTED: uncharacterized protein LOC107341068 [Acropora digitifera]|uniref:uncharacterized protein LOC107341068 n=1 Tax=Acropora digitifera TaxID=70779 RepID=UPI00077B06BF|nr:PREDICTED: uncharacterized protein LOC107341068 [Acropora digitifera]
MATLPAPHVPHHRKAKKAVSSPISAMKVTLLSSEWRSTKGGLSTINRELAIQLAKHSNVEVTMYLPQCSEEDKRAAAVHNVCIIEVPLIKEVHRECKWIQVVHTDPEELGMFKNYADSIAKGEKKHQAEVGLFFGHDDSDDFYLKGYDIAARAVAELCKHEPHLFKLVFVGAPKGEEKKVKELLLKEGIAASQLIVRSYKERKQLAAQFFEADLAIMPSRSEGFGLAALEALSAGLPVLVSGNSGFGDALKDLPFGSSCVVNSEDASEWAKAICTIHDKKRKLRLKEAVKVCESYAEEYHWEGECGRLVERMLNIIQVGRQGEDSEDQHSFRKYGVSAINLLIDANNTLKEEEKELVKEMLTQLVQTCDDQSRDLRGLKSFNYNLIKTYKVLLLNICEGSIVVSLRCPTLESLEHLWSDYRSGDLDKLAERYLVTDDMKEKLNLETSYLKITIDEENYLNCKEALMGLPGTCSENPGKDLLHPSETTTTEEKRQSTDVPESKA